MTSHHTDCPCGLKAAAFICPITGQTVRNSGLAHRAAQVVYEDARYFPYYDERG